MQPLRYGSVCSGIEAATTAWHPLGWQPVFFSEIEPFPSAVLAHHWPHVPNLGDLTQHESWTHEPIDLLVGGTPCQAFSVAGLREGLADPRGNLTLTFLAMVKRTQPRWVVWENVPGVLSDDTNAFGHFLSGLAELGYGWSYRVLDAQYFGVAQRRRRVFVVACAGGHFQRAAAVLFEPDCLRGHPPPRRETGEGPVGTISSRTTGGGGLGTDFDIAGGLQPVAGTLGANHGNIKAEHAWTGQLIQTTYAPLCSPALKARDGKGPSSDSDGDGAPLITHSLNGISEYNGRLPTLRAKGGDCAGGSECLVTHALRGEGFDASEDGTGRGTPLVPVAFSGRFRGDDGRGYDRPPQVFKDGVVGTIDTMKPHCIAFAQNQVGEVRTDTISNTLNTNGNASGRNSPLLMHQWRVRRLTPRECERLQGFPDDHTRIPWRKKPAEDCPDGPRYKAIGNSMAVPVMAWIGRRLATVDALFSPPISELRSPFPS